MNCHLATTIVIDAHIVHSIREYTHTHTIHTIYFGHSSTYLSATKLHTIRLMSLLAAVLLSINHGRRALKHIDEQLSRM